MWNDAEILEMLSEDCKEGEGYPFEDVAFTSEGKSSFLISNICGIFALERVAPSVLDVECRESAIFITRWETPFFVL